MKKVLMFFLIFSTFSFCQNLEEQIYITAETFVAKPSSSSFNRLIKKEDFFKQKVSTQDEQLALVFLQCHKGFYLDKNSKLKEAISTFEEALKRFNDNKLSAVSNFDIIESCLIPLGNLYTKIGDYTNAENTIKHYLFLSKKNNKKTHYTSGVINLSILYQTIGKHTEVLKLMSQLISNPKISKRQKKKLLAIRTNSQMALGRLSQRDTLGTLEHLYKNALQKKQYQDALKFFKPWKAKQLLNNTISPRFKAKLFVEEAQLLSLLNQNNDAKRALNKALKLLIPDFSNEKPLKKHQLYPENTLIDIFDLKAELELDPTKALKQYNFSFYVSTLLRRQWTSQETKLLNQTNDRNRSEACLDILFNLYQNTQNKDWITKALHYAENTKGSTLKEIFLKHLQLSKFPKDTLLQNEFQLIKEQERLTNLLIKEQLNTHHILKMNDYNQQLRNISLSLKALKHQIIKKYPPQFEGFNVKLLQQKLKEDTAILVNYFYGQHSIYQFIVTEHEINWFRINKNTFLEQQLVSFIHFFNSPTEINNHINQYTKQAFKMFQTLNLKVLNKTENVIIIADGLLNFIPFDALLKQQTSTTRYSKMPFVVFSNNLVFNSSIVTYLNTMTTTKNNKLLGFFPVFENTDNVLRFSKNEARVIKNEMPAKLMMNKKASKQSFIKNNKDYGILHFSTHAKSGDFITPASLSFFDEQLYLNELYSLNIQANLVVLSACETGLGKLYKSEGPMSIARGFQYSGVQNLLFSLWQINDQSTSQIMQSFYKNYSKHQSAFIANTQSKKEYLNNTAISNIKKSPYYWSAFVYCGAVAPVKQVDTNYGYILILLLCLSFVYFLLKKKKD